MKNGASGSYSDLEEGLRGSNPSNNLSSSLKYLPSIAKITMNQGGIVLDSLRPENVQVVNHPHSSYKTATPPEDVQYYNITPIHNDFKRQSNNQERFTFVQNV